MNKLHLDFKTIDTKKAGFGLFFVSLVVAILPLWPDTHAHIVRYDEWRFVASLLLLGLGVYALLSATFRQDWSAMVGSWSWMTRGLLLLGFTFGALSASQSALPRYGFLEWTHFILLAVLVFYVAHRVKKAPSENSVILLLGFAWMSLAFTGYFVHQFVYLPTGEAVNFKALFDDQPNPRFISQWQGGVIPLMVGLSMFALVQSRWVNALGWIAAIGMWSLVFVLGTRGVTLSLVVAIILVGFLLPQARRAWWIHNAIALLAGLAVYVLMLVIQSQDGEGLTRILTHGHVSDRLMIWEHAWMLFTESPWLGIGPMHYAHENGFYGVPGHPHNFVFQFLAEWGGIATLAFFIVGLWGFRQWFVMCAGTRSGTELWLMVALSTSFITTTMYGLVSGVWVMPIIQLAFAMLIGWMIGVYRVANVQTQSKALTLVMSAVVWLGLLGVVLFYGWQVYCGYEGYFAHLEQAFYMSESETVYPRFWVMGRIF